MIAAWRAASLGAKTRLIEKNPRLGLKIHISGGGKCNITHGGDMEALRQSFEPVEARFLRPAFLRFTNRDVLDLLDGRGVSVHARADGRVFPDSGRAEDVVDAFACHAREAGARIETGVPATALTVDAGEIRGARAGGRLLPARSVIVAVGGSSYPKTGTTGDGFRWLRELGHTVEPLRPALAPIYLSDGARSDWSGVALRDCLVRARHGGREISRWRGDLLYTHHGVSGPPILGISRRVALALEFGAVTLEADPLPDLGVEDLARQIADYHAAAGRRSARTLVQEWLPERLAPELLARSGIEPSLALNQLSRKARNRLVETLKRWIIGEVRAVPLERGEVTAGGVALAEVDPGTMASRRVKGLYLCGEILDIAGPVGGYNLQAAFSTGYVAGEAAASRAMTSNA
jgi:predicted Rossmann fold flavoprotein